MLTEKDFERDVEVAKRVLKETYVSNIVYINERITAGAPEDELKSIEELIIANERMIVYFDKGDEWVKELHEEAKRNYEENGDGTVTIDGSTDTEAEIARIEAARNS